MEVVTFPTPGGDRRYLLAWPTTTAAGPWPVVIFLHGTGGTANWADVETRLSAFAADRAFAIVFPDALPPDPSRPPKFLTNPPRWNDGSTSPDDLLDTNTDDVAFLNEVIADVERRGPIDSRRVYLTGFSNGAGMAFRFAAERADVVAAIAPVAGHCWVRSPRPSCPVPTLYIVGTEDPLIPLAGGMVRSPWGGRLVSRPSVATTLERWAVAMGCDPIGRSDVIGEGLRETVFAGLVEYRAVFVEGMGHHWPGGKGQLNPRLGGQPSNCLNANEVIWDFLSRYSQ